MLALVVEVQRPLAPERAELQVAWVKLVVKQLEQQLENLELPVEEMKVEMKEQLQ